MNTPIEIAVLILLGIVLLSSLLAPLIVNNIRSARAAKKIIELLWKGWKVGKDGFLHSPRYYEGPEVTMKIGGEPWAGTEEEFEELLKRLQ